MFSRYDDANHWSLKIPLSRLRWGYSITMDQMDYVRKYWVLTWKRRTYGCGVTEVRVRFGVTYL